MKHETENKIIITGLALSLALGIGFIAIGYDPGEADKKMLIIGTIMVIASGLFLVEKLENLN